MAKYYGTIGFSITEETSPGVYEPKIVERNYYGDVTRFTGMNQKGESINDDVTISNTISILADPYTYENSSAIRYICWMGAKWKVTSIEFKYPRLILTVGGVYNG